MEDLNGIYFKYDFDENKTYYYDNMMGWLPVEIENIPEVLGKFASNYYTYEKPKQEVRKLWKKFENQ